MAPIKVLRVYIADWRTLRHFEEGAKPSRDMLRYTHTFASDSHPNKVMFFRSSGFVLNTWRERWRSFGEDVFGLQEYIGPIVSEEWYTYRRGLQDGTLGKFTLKQLIDEGVYDFSKRR